MRRGLKRGSGRAGVCGGAAILSLRAHSSRARVFNSLLKINLMYRTGTRRSRDEREALYSRQPHIRERGVYDVRGGLSPPSCGGAPGLSSRDAGQPLDLRDVFQCSVSASRVCSGSSLGHALSGTLMKNDRPLLHTASPAAPPVPPPLAQTSASIRLETGSITDRCSIRHIELLLTRN